MPLATGTRLGPYEITGSLGAGGMGEVYRARDFRLGRDVAVKVLPAAYVNDDERRARFEREARAAAALNHSNVVAIHDVGTDGETPFIVSELLEGATLRDRMTPGAPWPVRRALDVSLAIAHGLAAAHARGIVHRDLKPDNVFLTRDGVVKILDFGLARLAPTAARAPHDATLTGTEAGTVLGTLGYMAPEQVRGLPADHRADIFALGAIAYEMLAGRRAFAGGTSADTMTAILTKDPPDLDLPTHPVPLGLARIVARCLEKTPEARFQSASDLAFALEGLSATREGAQVSEQRAGSRLRRLTVGTALALLALAGSYLVGRHVAQTSAAAPVMRLQIATGLPVTELAVSPDGRTIAYLAAPPGRPPTIWLRSLDRSQPHRLPGTEGASGIFWSHDSRFLAFISSGRLRKVAAAGGTVLDICASPGPFGYGGSWNEDDRIVFAAVPAEGLYEVSADGGDARLVTRIDLTADERHHRFPRFLPGTRRFLHTIVRGGDDQVCDGSLDAHERRCLPLPQARWFDYAPPGVFLFVRHDEVLAQALELRSMTLRGAPVALAGPLSHAWPDAAIFAVGGNVLAVRPEEPGRIEQLTWYDRQGRQLGTLGDPEPIDTFDLSPDGRRVAIARAGPIGAGEVMMVTDLARGVTSSLTGRENKEVNDPVWSPDGRLLAFRAYRGDRSLLIVKSADGGPERVLADGLFGEVFTEGWSPDGRYLAISIWERAGLDRRGALLPLEGKPEPIVFAQASIDESDFSPDGRWLAYNTDAGDDTEVFVVPVPPTGERWQVSAGGGAQPRWGRDGRELYYLALDGTLMAVSIGAGRRFEAAAPVALFQTGLVVSPGYDQFDVAPDGRFLITRPAHAGGGTVIDVVLNWQSALKP